MIFWRLMKLGLVLVYLIADLLLVGYARAEKLATLKICYEAWRPYAFKDSDGRYRGSILNHLQDKAKKQKVSLLFEELPFIRCVNGAREGVYDVALFVDSTDELVMLPKPIASWDIVVVTQKHLPLATKEAFEREDIKRVLIARDYIYPEVMLENIERLNKTLMTASYYIKGEQDIPRVFSYLISGRVDAMLIDKAWANTVLPKHAITCCSQSLVTLSTTPIRWLWQNR